MRNVFLAVFLVLAALTIAGCENTSQSQNQSQSSGFSGSSSTATAPTASAAVEQTPPPPPPTRNSTTQPLPPGWGYVKSGDLSEGPLK